MFTDKFREYAWQKYQRRRELLGSLSEEIEEAIVRLEATLGRDAALLMRFLYGTMPLCDAGDYDFQVFLSYVEHGLWLRKNVLWCQKLPEDLFLHYVLYYRVNTEAITPCREFFYGKLKDRIQGSDLTRAVLDINEWCARQAGYAASDDRTLSPLAVYRSGSGRCGEESVFVVSALRSVGIPARQVYAPWWAHCDDNHAWVEVYVEGDWHFLGACEPEEILDRGWFTAAASRALLVHSRTFFDYWESEEGAKEACIGKTGSVWYYNCTPRYARTRELMIQVKDSEGRPAAQAEVSLELPNMANYRQIARLETDEQGRAGLEVGLGDLHLHARKDGWYGEAEQLKAEISKIEILLDQRGCGGAETEVLSREGLWEPPKASGKNKTVLTREQKALGRARRQEAERLRAERIRGFYDPDRALEFPREQEILKLARGNFGEICRFLRAGSKERRRLLSTLSPKDYRDVAASTLEAFVGNFGERAEMHTSASSGGERAETYTPDFYERYVLCPRIHNEELTPYPAGIRSYFSQRQQETFQNSPAALWDYIRTEISREEEETYPELCGTPLGILRLGRGSSLGKEILFVAILRSLGVPARLNPMDHRAEYWQCGAFHRASGEAYKKGVLCLRAPEGTGWTYGENFGIGRLFKERFVPLDGDGRSFEDGRLLLELEAGVYRLFTANRLPNGSQQTVTSIFSLKEGQQRELWLSHAKGEGSCLSSNELEDFLVQDFSGRRGRLSDYLAGGAALLAFLEVGQEPTEHVLNEMHKAASQLSALPAEILFFLEREADLKNPTLGRVLSALPGIRVFWDPGFEQAGQLAREMFLEPERLPLLAAVKPGPTGIYGCSGYHVGSVDLTAKMIGSV